MAMNKHGHNMLPKKRSLAPTTSNFNPIVKLSFSILFLILQKRFCLRLSKDWH